MIKKIVIEQRDKKKMCDWDQERINNLDSKLEFLEADEEQIYVVSFDIANKNSKDQSVMMQFRLIDGRYIYEGYEFI